MLTQYVTYGDREYYRRIRCGYYILHPIKDGVVDYETSIREHRLVFEWANNVKLDDDVVIHHINFDKLDNSPENLVALSNSEHAKLHAKLRGKTLDSEREPNRCIDCGVEITKKAVRCIACAHKAERKPLHPTKEELAEMIKTMSNSEIARRLNVSDKAVGKWRKKYGLPSASEQSRMEKKAKLHTNS